MILATLTKLCAFVLEEKAYAPWCMCWAQTHGKSYIKSHFYHLTGEGVFAHGCLHCLTSRKTKHGSKVVYFDLKKEEFWLIDPPKRTRAGWVVECLVDLHGEVGILCIMSTS